MSEHSDTFTFEVKNGEVPQITIDGKKLYVVTCCYAWDTFTNENISTPTVIVSGYFDGDESVRVYKLQFTPEQKRFDMA
jgi:hypothetical protein